MAKTRSATTAAKPKATARAGKPAGAKLEAADALPGGATESKTIARRPTATRTAKGTKIPGEAFVAPTGAALPVRGGKGTSKGRHPTRPEAVDRRTEVAGSDEAARGKPRARTGE